jgi:chromosome segregation ATPase
MLTYQQLAESSENECDELRTQLTTLNAEHTSATAAAVAAAVAAAEATLAEQLHAAVTERDVTAAALAEALAASADATATADTAAASISELQRERDEAALALTSAQQDATSLREEVTSLQAQLRDAAAPAASSSATVSSSGVGSSDEQSTAELRTALAAAEGEVTRLGQVMQQQLDEVRNCTYVYIQTMMSLNIKLFTTGYLSCQHRRSNLSHYGCTQLKSWHNVP